MKTNHPHGLITCLLTVTCLLSACGASGEDEPDPLIGSWQSTDFIGNDRNELEILPDLDGEATIYFYLEGELFYADFSAFAFVIDAGRRYEIEMICDGNCSELDFVMDCLMVDDITLECDGDGAFSGYESFEFRRDY